MTNRGLRQYERITTTDVKTNLASDKRGATAVQPCPRKTESSTEGDFVPVYLVNIVGRERHSSYINTRCPSRGSHRCSSSFRHFKLVFDLLVIRCSVDGYTKLCCSHKAATSMGLFTVFTPPSPLSAIAQVFRLIKAQG